MKKSLLYISIFLLAILISGCSGDGDKFNGFLYDKTKMDLLVSEISKKTQGGKLFQAVHLTPEGSIRFQCQNPKDLSTVEAYYFSPKRGTWIGPEKIKVRIIDDPNRKVTTEDITNNSWNMDEVEWQQIPIVAQKAESRAKEERVEGVKIDFIVVDNEEISVKLVGKTKYATYTADNKGLLKNFVIR